ncbi:Mediator of RNA polymerase II transcription subunit 18 [Chytridiales sp. JEL 0842]|nr:Mediator of RNA polymerase II transcription subunit 18 [Chytridiales sp. JEL 0842]
MAEKKSIHQCSLHGLIPSANVAKLLERIVGLCGYLSFDGTLNLFEHEIVFEPIVKLQYEQSDPLLRVKAAVLDPHGSFITFKQRNWSLIFLGPPEPPKPGSLANVRVVYDSKVTGGDVFQYVSMLGYRMAFEFVRKGYVFHYGGMKITICRICTLAEENKVSSLKPYDPEHEDWLVELAAQRTTPESIPKTAEELNRFANYLRGLVELQVVDIR